MKHQITIYFFEINDQNGVRLPVRNIWSLEPGECIVAEEIMKRLKYEVFFPLRDIGIDLLVVKGNKHVGIQVKESRYYFSRKWRSGHIGHSWHQIKEKKFLRDKGHVDFYVFLTYLPVLGEHKISHFENKFLVVPYKEIERRIAVKDPGKREVYSFCFHFEGNKVWDERVTVSLENELTDYSEFLDAWHLIDKKLKN